MLSRTSQFNRKNKVANDRCYDKEIGQGKVVAQRLEK